MSDESKNSISSSEIELIQQKLLRIFFDETINKLQIFQRGLRLNAPVILPKSRMYTRSTNETEKVNKKGLKKSGKLLNSTDDMKNMPDEQVLNAIKVDKEVDTLIAIFLAAGEIVETAVKATTIDECVGKNSSERPLQALIDALQASENEIDVKTQELRVKQATLQSLHTQLDAESKASIERMQCQDEKIANLRHNLRNVRRLNDLEFDLIARWEANRLTQAGIVCANEERTLRTELENLTQQINDETRIIHEVEKFNAKQFAEFRAQIDEWKTKYANEMAKVTAETKQHEKRIMELAKIHERHEQTWQFRVAFVREYKELKAEEQRLLAEQMHRVESAVKLQAWWRGVMVRRGLGPYKKKTKKGRRGKGK